MRRLGIDAGSLYVSAAFLRDDAIVSTCHVEHRGDVAAAVDEALERLGNPAFDRVGVCGAIGRTGSALDPVFAVIAGAAKLLPDCRNVLSVGGEHFMIVFYDEAGRYTEHVSNPPCAAGTGSFIEQQAARLSLSAGRLSELADAFAGAAPKIATRCSVFAKSDLIHSMQEGFGVEAIAAGLCDGIARNLVDSLLRGRAPASPLGFVGGVSLNGRIVKTIARLAGVDVLVPEHAFAAGAVGAALLAEASTLDRGLFARERRASRALRRPLQLRLSAYPDFDETVSDGAVEVTIPAAGKDAPDGVWLGVDVGSTSTKAAFADASGDFVAGFYTATAGRPVEAVTAILESVRRRRPELLTRIRGAWTTGSGRTMVREVFRADGEINEITAHARAAVRLHPDTDTIIEIGGQDSKFTRLVRGEVISSVMNYVCAAGTGSFIEEQARRLGTSLGELSQLALGAEAPYTSDRCTVYMERDIGLLLSEGCSRESLLAAVLYSVRDNYLAKVVNRSPIGDHVVFQGATARNKALVAAFEETLGRPVHVSPYCHLTGAYGAALLALEAGVRSSAFLASGAGFVTEQDTCRLCVNHCVLTLFRSDDRGGRVAAWGMKCGRDYADRGPRRDDRRSAPEKRRDTALQAYLSGGFSPRVNAGPASRTVRTAGLADVLYNKDYLPLWSDMLSRLGFRVKVASGSARAMERGRAVVNADFCAPINLAHGVVEALLADDSVDFVFLPGVVNERDHSYTATPRLREKESDCAFCYYSQYFPTIVRNIPGLRRAASIVSPLVFFNNRPPDEIAGTVAEALASELPGVDRAEAAAAFLSAYASFEEWRRKVEILPEAPTPEAGEGLKLIVAGRPYIAFDPTLHHGIPRLFEELGARLIWQDEIPENRAPAGVGVGVGVGVDADAGSDADSEFRGALASLDRMHWNYGKKVLRAAARAAARPDEFLVYLTCFRCSPDSFLLSQVRDILEAAGKPYLVLQLDEHASDVGYRTRIEAFLRTFRRAEHAATGAAKRGTPTPSSSRVEAGDTVFIPSIDGAMARYWAECFRREGFNPVVLGDDEPSLLEGYRHASGGECVPAVAIAGGVVNHIRRAGTDPARSFLYLPSVCLACNFCQFPGLTESAVRSAGLGEMKPVRINGVDPGAALPGLLGMKIFEASIVAGLAARLYHRVRPYERIPGAAAETRRRADDLVADAIARGEGLLEPFGRVVELFRAVEPDPGLPPRPRIAVLGDLYLKYNAEANRKLFDLVESLGGEVLLPSFTEAAFHFADCDVRLGGDNPKRLKTLRLFEQRFERQAAPLLDGRLEPDFDEIPPLLEKHGFDPRIVGETSINVGRALWLLENKRVDAIVHVNPMFCCPGVVTASIFRKLQAIFDVPIVDLFYDGTGDPNRVLVPHLEFLRREKAGVSLELRSLRE